MMKRNTWKKLLSAALVTAMGCTLLTGCQPGGENPNPSADSKPSSSQSMGESPSDLVTITVDPNYDGAITASVERQAGDLIFKADPENGINAPVQRGYTFAGWFYDAEATEAVGENDTAGKDMTIYANWEAWDEETQAYMDLVLAEAEQARYITNRPTAYTKESFDAYQSLAAPVMFLTMGGGVFPKEMEGLVYGLAAAREALKLADGVTDPEETIWYIWGEDMPAEEHADEYDYYGTWDNKGFKPFLVPCMLEDQSQVKGNIILVSGGGFEQRANRWEAYPAIEIFNNLGYNCFVLQRRVAPSTPTDSGLDLQRSIRYLKYHAEEYGIAKIENLAAAGYSGGGSTIQIAVSQFYGEIQPTTVYPDYQCDEIDQVNSDLATMILVYSAAALDTENPNIPDAFVVHGSIDDLVDPAMALEAAQYYASHDIRYELHFFSDAAHGFGEGFGLNSTTYEDEDVENVKVWPQLADTFMSIQYGYIENIQTLS